MPLLEAGLRNDLAAGTSEEKSAFRLDHLALTEADGETFLEAKAVVLLQPCSRAAAVAEAVQAQVKSGALAFPSLREGGAPPTPRMTRRTTSPGASRARSTWRRAP